MTYSEDLKRVKAIPDGVHTRRMFIPRATAVPTTYKWVGQPRFYASNAGKQLDEIIDRVEDWKKVHITSILVLAQRCHECDGWGALDTPCPEGTDPKIWVQYGPREYCHHCNGEGIEFLGVV